MALTSGSREASPTDSNDHGYHDQHLRARLTPTRLWTRTGSDLSLGRSAHPRPPPRPTSLSARAIIRSDWIHGIRAHPLGRIIGAHRIDPTQTHSISSRTAIEQAPRRRTTKPRALGLESRPPTQDHHHHQHHHHGHDDHHHHSIPSRMTSRTKNHPKRSWPGAIRIRPSKTSFIPRPPYSPLNSTGTSWVISG